MFPLELDFDFFLGNYDYLDSYETKYELTGFIVHQGQPNASNHTLFIRDTMNEGNSS